MLLESVKRPKSRKQAQLGIYSLWLGTRIAQLLFLEITLKQINDVRNHIAPIEASVEIIPLFVFFSVMVHPISIGWIDAEGLLFRKYVGVRRVSWDSIESIRWTGPQVKI